MKALRRRLLRSSDEDLLQNKTNYHKFSALYKKNIIAAKNKTWKDFCSTEAKPFDIQYKIWKQKIQRHLIIPPLFQQATGDVSCEAIFSKLFPNSSLTNVFNFIDQDPNSTILLIGRF